MKEVKRIDVYGIKTYRIAEDMILPIWVMEVVRKKEKDFSIRKVTALSSFDYFYFFLLKNFKSKIRLPFNDYKKFWWIKKEDYLEKIKNIYKKERGIREIIEREINKLLPIESEIGNIYIHIYFDMKKLRKQKLPKEVEKIIRENEEKKIKERIPIFFFDIRNKRDFWKSYWKYRDWLTENVNLKNFFDVSIEGNFFYDAEYTNLLFSLNFNPS